MSVCFGFKARSSLSLFFFSLFFLSRVVCEFDLYIKVKEAHTWSVEVKVTASPHQSKNPLQQVDDERRAFPPTARRKVLRKGSILFFFFSSESSRLGRPKLRIRGLAQAVTQLTNTATSSGPTHQRVRNYFLPS